MKFTEKGNIIFKILFLIIFIVFIIKFGGFITHIVKVKIALNKAKSLAEINGTDKQIKDLIKHDFKNSIYKILDNDIKIKRDNNIITIEVAVKNIEISTPFCKKKFKLNLKETGKIS